MNGKRKHISLAFFIARRYLFARKSHNVINIISAISAAGMAVGTAALIIILSVYNGFDSLVKSMLSNIEPDLMVTPAQGKVFVPEGEAYDWLYDQERVTTICTVLQENVFLSYDNHQGLAKAKGVDEIYESDSPIRDHIRAGEWNLHRGDVPLTCVGTGLAHSLGLNPKFVAPVELYFPSRTRNISMINPASSIESVKVYPSGTFSINNDIDNEYLIVPIEVMRELLDYTDEVSAVEIRVAPQTTRRELSAIRKGLSERLGPDYKVSDRFAQNESLYKMLHYEKASIYLILIFVIIIIAFNIFGSLTMLIIEKKGDIQIFHCLGASQKLVRRIFVLEGWLISITGLVVGLAVGIVFALIQQHFGIIKMPGNFLVQAYPVILRWSDILLTSAGVALIGYVIALFPVVNLQSRIDITSLTGGE